MNIPSQSPSQLQDPDQGLAHIPQDIHQGLVPDQDILDHLHEVTQGQGLTAVDIVIESAGHIPDLAHQALTEEGTVVNREMN